MNMDRPNLWPLNPQVAHTPEPAQASAYASDAERIVDLGLGIGAPSPRGSQTVPASGPEVPRLPEPPLPTVPGRLGTDLPPELGIPSPRPSYMADPSAPWNPEPVPYALPNRVPFTEFRQNTILDPRVLLSHKYKEAIIQNAYRQIGAKMAEVHPPEITPYPFHGTGLQETIVLTAQVLTITPTALRQVNRHLEAWVQWYDALPRWVRDQLPPSPGPFRYEEP